MMVPSTAAARDIPVGLGQAFSVQTGEAARNLAATVPTATSCLPEQGCFPWWCRFVPTAWAEESCRIPTAQEQAAAIKADIEKAAGAGTPQYNPQLAADQYAEFLKDQAAYCQAHPDECAEYQSASENPTCASIIGTGKLAQTFCKNPGGYVLLGAAVILGTVLWAGTKR